MTSRKWNPLTPSLVGATFLVSQIGMILFGQAGQKAEAKNVEDTHPAGITTQGATSICTPIFGTGKSVGVPITVKKADGTTVTDISKYTFEMYDGTNTQDVTDLIGTAAEQPVITGQLLSAYGNYPINGWGAGFRAVGTRYSKAGPTLSFSNPGYFFLGCTKDGGDDSVKFPEGTILRLKSGATVVASVSLAGRGATYMGFYEFETGETSVSAPATPTGRDNTDFENLYKDFTTLTGVRLRPAFAAMAMVELSNNPDFGPPYRECLDDLVDATGTAWTWTTAGQNYINELTSTAATAYPILKGRTTGTLGTNAALCDLAISSNEDDFFIRTLAVQMLLIDGPKGLVNSTIANANDFFARASVLQLGSVATAPKSTSASVTFTPITRQSSAKSYQYSIDGGKTWNTATVTPAGGGKLRFEMSGLEPSTNYTVQIRAITLTDQEVPQGVQVFTTQGRIVEVGSDALLMAELALLMIVAGTVATRFRRRHA